MDKINVLKKYFGYTTFREGQEALIDHLMVDQDVLGIMPTSGGKSICYQIPALLKEGITIVVSPLIALMKDQVDNLKESGIAATFLNSTLSIQEAKLRQNKIIKGEFRLVYVAPERLLADDFVELCQSINVSFLAIDEAHCISQWGHDFRPSYKNIPLFIETLNYRPVIGAFTATATKIVVEEIKELLSLKEPFELVTGFDRPNLIYRVIKPSDKLKYIKDYIKKDHLESSGIIYCATRKAVMSLTQKLKAGKFNVAAYHGGLEHEVRTKVQEQFMQDKVKIIVATNAFGMGIDKPDVRFVIHYNMPKNMESYYQEAGRAGRDGDISDCILMYSPADIVKQKMLMSLNDLSEERLAMQRENLQYLVNYCHSDDCLRNEITRYFGEDMSQTNCNSCGNCLHESEYVDMTLEAQKILSCIYRMNERYGVAVVIQTLRGSKSQKIIGLGLDQLTTYGILDSFSEGALREVIMNLIARGYIHMTTDQFPVLKLTQQSKQVLKGEEKVFVKQDRVVIVDNPKIKGSSKSKTTGKGKGSKGSKKSEEVVCDSELFDMLANIRGEIAKEKGIPRFYVFSNATLIEMANQMPISKEEFLNVKGVGENKLTNYGDAFIAGINQYIKDNK